MPKRGWLEPSASAKAYSSNDLESVPGLYPDQWSVPLWGWWSQAGLAPVLAVLVVVCSAGFLPHVYLSKSPSTRLRVDTQ